MISSNELRFNDSLESAEFGYELMVSGVTAQAVQVSFFSFGHERTTWIPKSQIIIQWQESGNVRRFEIEIPVWMLKEKEII